MQVTNTNNQLRVVSSSNIQFYKYEGISNVTWAQSSGSYFVLITYEDDYFVKLPLANITNQVAWTNSVAGANIAVDTISGWISSSISTFGLATEATLQQVETNTTGVARTPGIIRPSNTSGNLNTVSATFYSVSVANVGLVDGTVLGAVIRPGEILNFSADALNNFFSSFAYDSTGTEFIITYVS
jgi:hypothetical protein